MLTRRKALVRSALCLLLGAVTTWLVAWGLAAWGPKAWGPHWNLGAWGPRFPDKHVSSLAQPSIDGLLVYRERRWTVGVESRTATTLGLSAEALVRYLPEYNELVRTSEPHAPASGSWGRSRRLGDAEVQRLQAQFVDEGFGWPLVSHWYPVQVPWDGAGYAQSGAIELFPITKNAKDRFRALPLLPAWPGFLLNTGFYAAIWALPLFGLPLLRQSRRNRKGRCPNCAYDLNRDFNFGCPECGWRR